MSQSVHNANTFTRTVHNLAAMDIIAVAYLVYFNLRLLLAPASADTTTALWVFGPVLGTLIVGLLLSRGELIPQPRLRSGIYRAVMMLAIVGTYFALRPALAALQPVLLDLKLAAIDTALFGVVPSVWMESFVTPTTTEWFAFFYYSYFGILSLSLLPALFFGSGARTRELLVGPTIIVSIGHLLYTLVPGKGPYAALTFQNELAGGFFWGLVQNAVAANGALLDIFPSLHTALPMFFSIHAIINRKQKPFAYTWPILLFFSVNIMGATLFLRWHYAIDVIVGLTLAVAAALLAPRLSPSDDDRRRKGKQPVLEPFLGDLWTSESKPKPIETSKTES